jgi:hypothetical protein
VEDDPEYQQALIEEGCDPDDPHLRAAIADVVALLRRIGDAERAEADRTNGPYIHDIGSLDGSAPDADR